MTSPSHLSDTSTQTVVAIGASAGGLTPLKELLAALPENLAAPIVIAQHSEETAKLTDVLQKNSPLKIVRATDGETLKDGTIYVVPGATHGFFRAGKLHLSPVVQNSGYRPSIDALFMTLAAEYGDRAIGVVLSGTMADGMRGAQIIHDVGGKTIVQDPSDAQFPDMPRHVIRRDHPVLIEAADELGKWLAEEIGTLDKP